MEGTKITGSVVWFNNPKGYGFLKRDDKIVVYNTGSGLKYLEVLATEQESKGAKAAPPPRSRAIAGIIGPY